MTTPITREYLDQASRLYTLPPAVELIAALRRVLDLRDDEWRKMRERGAPFFLIPVERLDAALAGTQPDDGAGGSTPAVSSGGETPPGEQSPAPAPSSPDPRHAIVHDLLYDYWEALHDDSLDHATREVIAALDAYLAEEPTHVPCCSAHGESMTCEKYRRTHFVEVRPCCSVDAERLAGTQTDDGAVSTVAAEGVALGTAEPAPAPSSPVSLCGCSTNEAGDIRCHKCGQRVNVRCWNCGTPRGEGECPNPRPPHDDLGEPQELDYR